MQFNVQEKVLFPALDLIVKRLEEKAYPFNRPDAVVPQKIIPEELRANKRTLACFYFYTCIYMRGGIESLQAFNALIRLWRVDPELFDPTYAQWLTVEQLQPILKTFIGWDSANAAYNWIEISRRLVKHWKGNPLNLLKHLRTWEEASRRIRNKRTKRDLRLAGKNGQGFEGFQYKMVSMLLYFYDWEGWLEKKFIYPSPADFHNFRFGLTIEAIVVKLSAADEVRLERDGVVNIRANDKLSAPWRAAIMRYLRLRKMDPVKLADAIWLFSLLMCGNSPATTTKVEPLMVDTEDEYWPDGRRKWRQISLTENEHFGEVWDHGEWVVARKSKGLGQTCFVCPLAKQCRYAIPARAYYRKPGGIIQLRPHPMLKMNVPFDSFRVPNPNEVEVDPELQHLLALVHPAE